MNRKKHPDILVIMTDQHRGDSFSAAGHPIVQTPNIDTIGGMGVRFTHSYSSCPSCIAARRSFLSGLAPASHGLVGYQEGVEWEPKTTLPAELTRAGYQTGIVGRTMHQYPRWKRYGFEYMNMVTGVEKTDYEFAIAQASGGDAALGYGAHGIHGNGWTARPWHLDESLHEVNWTVTETIKWLRRRDPTSPFFCVLSLNPPHPPFVPPQWYLDRYLNMEIPEPFIGDWAEEPLNDGLGLLPYSHTQKLTGQRNKLARAGYYASINHIDDQLGRVIGNNGGMPSTSPEGPLEDMIVVYTADHGEMLGDHYRFAKGVSYEGAARIPLMVRGPGIQKGLVIEQAVCLEDLMPTLLELAGCSIPENLDGISLAPLLRGEQPGIKRKLIHGEHAGADFGRMASHYLTDGKEKYIWFPQSGREQLFDLGSDPNEIHNLAHLAGYTGQVAKWRKRLIEKLRERPEGFSDGNQLIAGKSYSPVIPGG